MPGSSIGEELRGMLAGQGKGTSGPSGARMQEAMQDLQIHDAPPSASAQFRQGTGRSRTPISLDDEYAAFQSGKEPQITDRIVTPSANSSFMEQAWQSSVNNRAEPPAVHAPYTAPAKPAVDIQGDAQNFLAALDAAELEPDELDAPASRPVAPVRLTQAWRPPSPSHGYAMTEEQYAMHERLAMLQTGVSNEQPYRQAEAIEPPADDAALGEGVYAPTPDKALASVWDAQSTRAAHVQQFREDEKTKPVSGPSYTKIRGQEIVDKLRGWLVREGYTEVRRLATHAGCLRSSSAGYTHVWRGNERCEKRTGRGTACQGNPPLGCPVPPSLRPRTACRERGRRHGELAGKK